MRRAPSRRLPRPPLALVVGLAAIAAFGPSLVIGWSTSPRREELRKPTLLGKAPPVPRLKVLRAAAAFPDAPKRRSVVIVRPTRPHARAHPGAGKTKLPPPPKLPRLPPIAPTGKLIVGSG